MNRVRSAMFLVVFLSGTALAIAVGVFVALAGRRALHAYVEAWTRFHALCAAAIMGIRTRVEGRLPDGPALVAAKHESMYETLELVRLLGHPAVVVKRQITDFPIWAPVTKLYGMVPVDREASAAAMRAMLRSATVVRAERRSLLIFPEGTRVAPGESPPLRAGLAGLYRHMGLPLVPVALDSGSVWPRRGAKRPGIVTMRFGEPIPPGLPRAEVEARVHAAINALNA